MDDETIDPGSGPDLAAQWAAERCPCIDGVVFGDGRVKQVLALWKDQGAGRLGIVLEPGPWTTLAALDAERPLHWTGAIELHSAEDRGRGIRILCGEAGYGSDGFVASLRGDAGEIAWIAFFTTSNPFEELQIRGDHVLARTNLGQWWRFPLDAPERVTLQ